jgi:hypothetical protein
MTERPTGPIAAVPAGVCPRLGSAHNRDASHPTGDCDRFRTEGFTAALRQVSRRGSPGLRFCGICRMSPT